VFVMGLPASLEVRAGVAVDLAIQRNLFKLRFIASAVELVRR